MKKHQIIILLILGIITLIICISVSLINFFFFIPSEQKTSIPQPETLEPTPTMIIGIAHTRQEFVDRFELKHQFVDWTIAKGENVNIVSGKSPDGLGTIQLSSFPDDEEDLVTVVFFSPYTKNDEMRRNNINYMFDAINFAIPGWDEAEQWLELGLSQDDTKTTYRNIDITFTTHFLGETVAYVLIDERE